MNIWSKILIGLLFVCSAIMFYFALKSLGSRTAWQKRIQQLETDLANTEANIRLLEYGIDSKKEAGAGAKRLPAFQEGQFNSDEYEKAVQKIVYGSDSTESLTQLRNDVDILIMDQDSRTWFPCAPGEILDKGTEVTIGVVPKESVFPVIAPKTLVYLFDTRTVAEGGSFLGAFYFEDVAQNQAVLKNSYLMTAAEVERLNESKAVNAPWVAYTKLPGDNKGYFIETDSDAGPTPYASTTAFFLMVAERIKQQQFVDTLNIHLEKIKQTIEEGKEHDVFYKKVISETKDELNEMNRQRDEVLALRNSLNNAIVNLEKEIAALKTDNKKKMAQMTEAQLSAAEIIHQREAGAGR